MPRDAPAGFATDIHANFGLVSSRTHQFLSAPRSAIERPSVSPLKSAFEWINSRFSDLLTWGIVAGTFAAGYVAFIRHWPSFFPDSRYYLAMAFWFGGDSQELARERLVEFAKPFHVAIPNLDLLFGWGLVQPRVVLPAIATPFVKVFGPYGLTLTTGLITVVLTIALTTLLIRKYGNLVAVAVMLLINGSTFLMWINGGMLTESLSAVWTVIVLILGWRYIKNPRWILLVGLVLVTALSAFTRQATLIDAGALVMAWLLGTIVHRRNSPWLFPAIAVTASSLACQVIQTLIFSPFSQLDQFIKQSGADTLGGALLAIPTKVRFILTTDFRNFMLTDHALMFIVILSVVSMVIFWRREESHLLFGAILAVALYNITNGTPTTFRYAVPGLVFYVLSLALLFSRTAPKVRDVTRKVISETPTDA
jgi:hypothetical protein